MSVQTAIAAQATELAHLTNTDPIVAKALRRVALAVGVWARHNRYDVALSKASSYVRNSHVMCIRLDGAGQTPAFQNALATREESAERFVRANPDAREVLLHVTQWILNIEARIRGLSEKHIITHWSPLGYLNVIVDIDDI